MKEESFVYDRTLRELFHEVPGTLVKLLSGQGIKEVLETSFPKVEERRVDLLARLEDNTLFHLEIQSVYDPLMPVRMLKYAVLIYEHYHVFPRQMVLYIGVKKIRLENKISRQNLCYTYAIRDIGEFDCRALMESDDITDNIIAILCQIEDMDRFYQKLMQKLARLESKKREDYLRKLFYLMRLRPDVAKMLKERGKEHTMPFVLDKEIDPLYREGIEKGQKEREVAIARELLKQKVDIKVIAKSTGLSEAEVKKLSDASDNPS